MVPRPQEALHWDAVTRNCQNQGAGLAQAPTAAEPPCSPSLGREKGTHHPTTPAGEAPPAPVPDPACLVQTGLGPAEHLTSNSSAMTEKPPRTPANTLHLVKRFRERGWKIQLQPQTNTMSACHRRARAPEKRHKLIQLVLRTRRRSKDTSALGEEGTRGKAVGGQGHVGRPNHGGAGGSGSPPSQLGDQLIVQDWCGGRGRADMSRNYRRARTDTQGMAGLLIEHSIKNKANPLTFGGN